MIKLLKFVPVQLSCFLTLGIIAGYSIFVEKIYLLPILLALLVIFMVSYILVKQKFLSKNSFSILGFLVVFAIGFSAINLKDFRNNKHHYTHHKLKLSEAKLFQIKIDDVLKSSAYYHKYEVSIKLLNKSNYEGKLLLQIKKDSQNVALQVDDILITKTKLKAINKPLNPFEFNYKNYLKSKGIVHQIVISSKEFVKLENQVTSLKGLAAKFRSNVNTALRNNGFKGNQLAIINALLLGQRQFVSNDVMENYAQAGAVHILAVSGLHVGILMLFLTFLLKPLTYFKKGKIYILILTVITLWIYAVIAGLSPSVVRAVTMFSFLSVGIILQKQTNVYNTLSISFFILLLLNPIYLFEVGFQMSYLAVFFIVWLQPKIAKLLYIKNWVLHKVWQLLTVSLAAQVGVLPISLYYFHQFPGLFFISNIVIVPFLGFILGLGVMVILFSLLNILPTILGKFYNLILYALNKFVEWVALQESFIITNIPFSQTLLLVSYSIIFSFFLFVETKKTKLLVTSLCLVLVLQGVLFFEKHSIENSTELVVFNKTKHTVLALRNGREAKIYTDLDSIENNTYPLKPYFTENRIKEIHQQEIPNFITINNQVILIINNEGIYKYKTLKPDIVLLQKSPKINLERLITHLNPKLIIADASNYKSYVERWKATCIKKETPFYSTTQKGAFINKMM